MKRWTKLPRFDFAGGRMRAFLTPDDTTGLSCYHIKVPKNGRIIPAYHKKAIELIWLMKGSGIAQLGPRRVRLKQGDGLFIYPPTPHGFVAGSSGMVILAILSPRVDSKTDFYSWQEEHAAPKVLSGRLVQGTRR